MFKTIMVPIDLAHAEKGKPAIEVARTLASKDAQIILVNVVEDVPTFVAAQLPGGIMEKKREEAHDTLTAMANAAAMKATVEVRTGTPRTAILAAASEHEADLIIVGSHTPGLEDYLLGSTAARVVRHAKCSVLVLR